ncbi:MAG: type II secretion system minor pseudopilin GspK [Thermodesulfobacteriota bacterium]|nr:type II secretion system minor pseudopilin GspK [Thermodesulfobacteriota bacterium]
MKRSGNEDGMALLLVLAITAMLAALLSQLAFTTLVDLRLTETYRDTTRAYYLAKGGIQIGRMVLADDDNNYDGSDELWAQGIANYPVGDLGLVSITIVPLDGRINVNQLISSSGNIDAVIKDRCLRLFDILEIADPETHIDTLIDWIDNDDDPQPAGAEANYYAGQTPAAYCKNAPMDTLDELLLVAGFSNAEVNKLRPHLSIYGTGKLHLNSATAPVLYALAQEIDISSAEMIVEQRKIDPFHSVDELKLLPGWDTFYWAINAFLNVKANYYRINTDASVSDGRRSASATVKKGNNTLLYFQM